MTLEKKKDVLSGVLEAHQQEMSKQHAVSIKLTRRAVSMHFRSKKIVLL